MNYELAEFDFFFIKKMVLKLWRENSQFPTKVMFFTEMSKRLDQISLVVNVHKKDSMFPPFSCLSFNFNRYYH